MGLPSHLQIMSGFGKTSEEEEKLFRIPTHEQIVGTQKIEVQEPEPTSVFGKLKSFIQKFIPEAIKTAGISDEALKARFKGTYALLSRQVEDAYRGEGIVGNLMSIPTATFLIPKSYREKQADKMSELAKNLQDSAFKDMKVVEDYLKENPLVVDMEGVAFKEKMKDPEWVARGLTLNAPSLLASLGISTIVGITTKNPALAYAAAFGTSFSQEAGESYNDAIKAGDSEKEARTVGTIVGAINGVLDSLFPGSKAANLMGGKQIKKQFFKRLTTVVIDVVKEGSTESLQEIVSNVGRSVYEENVDLLQGTKEAGFFGALMGGITSISTETYQQLRSSGVEVNEGVIEVPREAREREAVKLEPTLEEEKSVIERAGDYTSATDFAKAEFDANPTDQIGRIDVNKIEARDTVDEAGVKEYVEKIKAGEKIEPVEIIKEGEKLVTLDGSHRITAYQQLKQEAPVIYRGEDKVEGLQTFEEVYKEAKVEIPPKPVVQPPIGEVKKEVRVTKEIVQLQEKVIEEKIKTTKDVKGVRDTIKSISQDLNNAVTEAEGRAIVAQEQRAGLNVEDINQLKRIYALNKKFQEGDIETIRASKSGPLLNRVLENIQEKYPKFSEQEAFDFAVRLPTKVDEQARTSEIVQLEKKEKKLRGYLDQLRTKQKELGVEESELLTKEWESVLAAQERLRQLIRVPEAQLPVGEGPERVSRLEARVKDALGKITTEEQEVLGLSTYRQMNKADQIAKASKYVSENTDEALKVLKGDIDPPTGLLRNSIYVALKELGSADTQIATQIASLASTRMGQEISILSELDIYSPVSLMEDVVNARIEGYKRKGKDVNQAVERESGKIKIDKPSGSDWDSFLASIRC